VSPPCDLCCLHGHGGAPLRRHSRDLTTAEAHDLLTQLAELQPGLVVLAGADPSKRFDLDVLIVEAVRLGLRIAVAPSVVSSLTAASIERIAALGVTRLVLGLDGPDAPTHDRLRDTPGSFADAWAAIGAAHQAGLALTIGTTLTRQSVEAMPRLAGLVEEVRPATWNVLFAVPIGRAREDQALGLAEWSSRTEVMVETTAAPAYRRVLRQRAAARGQLAMPPRASPPPVNDGKGCVFVSHVGDVYPSALFPLTTANVREARLADVYRRSRLFRALRDERRLEGRCGRCPFRSLCGGSRARALAVTGNFLAEDPACAYKPPRMA
jgi:radical SAM protein with 4Fe4S-binding SPASM domain